MRCPAMDTASSFFIDIVNNVTLVKVFNIGIIHYI